MIIKTTKTEPETIVPNDGKALYEVLGLDEGTLEHCGNFIFDARKGGAEVTIYAEPYDEEHEFLRIKEVYIEG